MDESAPANSIFGKFSLAIICEITSEGAANTAIRIENERIPNEIVILNLKAVVRQMEQGFYADFQ